MRRRVVGLRLLLQGLGCPGRLQARALGGEVLLRWRLLQRQRLLLQRLRLLWALGWVVVRWWSWLRRLLQRLLRVRVHGRGGLLVRWQELLLLLLLLGDEEGRLNFGAEVGRQRLLLV